MASDFGNWLYIALAGLLFVKGSEANGSRAVASVFSVLKSDLVLPVRRIDIAGTAAADISSMWRSHVLHERRSRWVQLAVGVMHWRW